MERGRKFYYADELNDEFSGIKRNTVTVDQNYHYIHKNLFWRMGSFFVYRIIMTPVAYLYMKIKFHMKIKNRSVLREHTHDGYFMFGNHTQVPGDGYIPTVCTFPKKDIVIVNADNISMRGTRTFMEMIGAYPLPTKLDGMTHFMSGLKYHVQNHRNIVIYPEAHIWPYYTGIRPYKDAAFAYPVMFHKPSYSFTVTYQKRQHSNQPKMTIYVDGPFYADDKLARKEAQRKLRDDIYETMKKRSENSNYEYVQYIKKDGEIT